MIQVAQVALCSQIHTEHINTLCGQNVQLLNVKLAVHIVTTGLQRLIKIVQSSNVEQPQDRKRHSYNTSLVILGRFAQKADSAEVGLRLVS